MNKNDNKSILSNVAYEANFEKEYSDEIDLKELFLAIWRSKIMIIVVTMMFAASGVLYSLSLPNVYKSEIILSPAGDNSSSNGLSAMASQFGGLANMAGINLGNSSGGSSKAITLATLKSRKFINSFISKHDLLVPLLAAESWDIDNGQLNIDENLYDEANREWVREVKPGKSIEPTDWEAYKKFNEEVISIVEAKDTGLITISITHYSPVLAQQWVTMIIEDINSWMKNKSLQETERNISYLRAQLESTNVADMRTVFYQLIEEQTKNLMLAEVEKEFSLRVIDPAVIPEEKAGPKRALICVLFTLLGGAISIIIVLIRFSISKSR